MLNLPWIVYVLVAALIGTLVGFIDNYIADVLFEDKHPQAQKMVAGIMYALIGVGILAVLRPSFDDVRPILLIAGSGVVSSISSIFYFAAIAHEETTTAKIFAQLIPVFALIMGWIFLGQKIDTQQMLAFGLVMLAPVIVIMSKGKRARKTGGKAAALFITEAVFVAASSILFVYGQTQAKFDFLVAMAIMVIGKGCMDVILMSLQPKWRRHFHREVKKQGRLKIIFVIALNVSIYVLADMLYRFATVQADVLALPDAAYRAGGLIGTFFLGILFSLLWPKFGRENLNKRSVMAHLIATVVATIGIVLLAYA